MYIVQEIKEISVTEHPLGVSQTATGLDILNLCAELY